MLGQVSFNQDGRTDLPVSHLKIMYDLHARLTGDLDYWMTDTLAIEVVLFSLPPSYKDVVADYVMRGE